MSNYTIKEEIWKDIEGYEGLYKVSNLGRVKSLDRLVVYSNGTEINHKGKFLSFEDNKGYNRITLSKGGKTKRALVHRLVAKHFIPHDNHKPHVNHIDGIKTNNIVSNLEWCTPKENENHSYDILGKQALRGEEKNQSKLTNEDVIEMRDLYKYGYLQRELADIYHISRRHVSDIVNKKRWGWLE